MYKLIISGDSHTNYLWPGWADFLTWGYKDRINLGKWGTGNDFIFFKTYPYLQKANDTKFIISWAESTKFDIKKENKWIKHINMPWAEYVDNRYLYDHFYDHDYWVEKSNIYVDCFTTIMKQKGLDYWYACATDFNEIYNDTSHLFENKWNEIGYNNSKAHIWETGRFGETNQLDYHLMAQEQLPYAKKLAKLLNLPMIKDWSEIAADIDKRIYSYKDMYSLVNKPITLEEYS